MPEAIGLTVLMILEPVRLEATRLTVLLTERRLVELLRLAIGLLRLVLVLEAFLLVENLFFAILPKRLSLALCLADLMRTTLDIVVNCFQLQKLKRLFVIVMNQSHHIERLLIYQH